MKSPPHARRAGAGPTNRRRRALPLALVVACAMGLAGCKTRLLEWGEEDPFGPPGPSDLAAPTVPDLRPPPDLKLRRDNCGVEVIQTTQIIRADLLIVLDRSRSMRQGTSGQNNPPVGQSKWELVRAAIKQVVSKTTTVDWGLMLFGSDTICNTASVPQVPVGPGTAPVIAQVLDATTPDATTPTTRALNNALTWFVQQNNGHPHFMLLATDGQPSCAGGTGSGNDSVASIQAVADAASVGIKTFVVGIGSNTGAEQTLQSMAVAGQVPNMSAGQPAWYAVTSTQDLVKILEQAAIRITPCSYPIAGTPPDPNLVTITGQSGPIPRDRTHMNGWDFSDDGKSVVFFGDACVELQSGVTTSVQATFGCPGDE